MVAARRKNRQPERGAEPPAPAARRPWALGLLAGAALVVAAVRLHLADLPLERDEGEYAYFAQLLLRGIPPYAEAYSMKMPGIYVAYALVLALLGQTATAIRLGLLAANLATMWLLFLLGRRLADAWTGAVAGAVYGLLALSVSVLGFAAHATHFVVLCAVGGLLLLLRAIESGRTGLLAASGALLGLAYTMKQHGIVFAALGAFWLWWQGRDASRALTLRRLVAFCTGAAAPFVLVSLALLTAGVFSRFWFWNFVYAGTYVRSETLARGWDNLDYQIRHMQPLYGLALLALLGLFAPLFDASARRSAPFLRALLLCSTLAVLPGLHFRHHYFIQVWPALALLAGVGVTALARRVHRFAAAAVFLAAAGYALASERALLFRATPVQFCRAVYHGNPFPESIEIAEFVKTQTGPDDRIAVLGSEPQIFFYSKRRSASGHIYMYGLMEEQPYSLAMQQEFEAEIEAARPSLVIFVKIYFSWLGKSGSENDLFRWAEAFLVRDYEPAGLIDFLEDGSRSVWGEEAGRSVPRSENFVLVYRRKTEK